MSNRLSAHRSGSHKQARHPFRLPELLESRCLFNVFTVTSVNDAGGGSLRDAIKLANENPGTDTIEFDLPGADTTIRLTGTLPQITDPIVIDGSSQPGFAGSPLVTIRAPFFGGIGPGNVFHLIAGDSTIRGLCITHGATAILITNNGGNTIVGNYIGTDLSGRLNEGNHVGISIETNNNTIGGATPADRNVVAASAYDGVVVYGSGNTITNNYIGTDATGTAGLGNGYRGISVEGGTGNAITNNLISSNAAGGIRLVGASRSNVIRGNKIGTDVSGRLNLGNGGPGVRIEVEGTAGQNVVGGVGAGEPNVIAFNGGAGVVVLNNTLRNTIRGNRIFNNSGLGIAMGGGVNGNDEGDADDGPNGLLNAPVLGSAFQFGATAIVTGNYNSAPAGTYTLDFYSTSTPDPSGRGEAATYLGSTTVTTDAMGNATFNASLAVPISAGQAITATATDEDGSTSEFALNLNASFAGLRGGRLVVTGTRGGDRVALSVKGSKLRVSADGAVQQFNVSAVKSISVTLGDGNDTLTCGAGVIAVSADGGRGNDRLNGGDGRDLFRGGEGSDSLSGGGGSDRLYGGDGDDVLVGGTGDDRMFGQNGNDFFVGNKGADFLDGGLGRDRCDDADASDVLISFP